jgi:hypothetical protein
MVVADTLRSGTVARVGGGGLPTFFFLHLDSFAFSVHAFPERP